MCVCISFGKYKILTILSKTNSCLREIKYF